MSCNKLETFCPIFLSRKKWHTGVTTLISTRNFYVVYLPDGLMEQKGVGSFSFLRVLVLQWNSYQHFWIYVCSKITQNIWDIIKEQYQNMQNGVSLFTWRFIHYNTFTLEKNCSERLHVVSGHLVKVFYKMTTCLRLSLLIVSKSDRLMQVWL